MAATSLKGAPLPDPSSPVNPDKATNTPVDKPLSEENEQLRESTHAKEEPAFHQLALPQVLTEHLHWTTTKT